MKTCYIFGSAPISDYHYIQIQRGEEDTVICADGGYTHALACGILPDWLVGDFDSNRETDLPEQVIRVKPEKDETDLYLALSHGISLGYDNFIIYGGLGGRMDHTIANLQTIVAMKEKGISVTLVDAGNEISVLTPGCHPVKAGGYQYLSLFSFTPCCEGVTLRGMKYPLTDYTLTCTDGGFATSNELLEEEGQICFRSGILLLVRANDCGK